MKLRLKLAGAFALIVAAGSVASVLAISLTLRRQMQTFVFEGDTVRARNLAASLGDYYAARGSFEGAFDVMPPPFPDAPRAHAPSPNRGRGMGMMRRNMMEPARVVLVDARGSVLFDSAPAAPGTLAAPDVVSRGIAVEADGETVGYVAVGSMINPELAGLELSFLNSVSLAVLVSSLAAALFAAAVGTAFVLQITSPLKTLERATERIAAGDFRSRVGVKRRDEIGDLAANFNRMAGALEENERLRRKMVEDAAHELRTPVSLLQANVEMMLEGIYPLDRANLLSLNDEIGRLSLLVQELDTLNDADTGGLALRAVECSLPSLLERSAALFRVPMSEKKITLKTDIPADLPSLRADPDKLIRVFYNVLSNAVRHTITGGSIGIAIIRDPGQGQATVRIRNTGPAIPESDLERIFERFYRSDPARSRNDGGSGLGLAISREIVKLHGGRIWAENTPPGEVSFFIRLPLHS